ncbi:GMC oxidoreductase [Arthrobacter sp. SD76]|uniref:GMC oxidoreductase n=1 Tax=Arthrobacter sp. SD76 TaxID=3415007 RepID=UPI003C714E2C
MRPLAHRRLRAAARAGSRSQFRCRQSARRTGPRRGLPRGRERRQPLGGPIMLGERGSSLHVMGTHRMGRDRKTSVTDPECRVWDWNNLYLAGNGILGARNSCNPTLTTIALALHTARAIHAQHPLH